MPEFGGQAQQAMLDTESPRPSRGSVVRLMIWCAIEATFFAFALQPTMAELVSDLGGFDVPPIALLVPLWVFLTIVTAGSFALIQAMNDAVKARQIGNVVANVAAVFVVAVFQVIFIHRELVDGMTPWLAQQGLAFGEQTMYAVAALAWIAVRGMTWYLIGRSAAPALAAVLIRHPG